MQFCNKLYNDWAECYFDTLEEGTLRNVNNYLNTIIYSYLETSGGKSSNLYLKVGHFFNNSVNKTSEAA